MEWVDSEGSEFYEWTNNLGETIANREFFGRGHERGSRPVDVPLRIEDRPQAFLTQRPPGNVIEPHFHEMPQFQIMFEGAGRIGKHPVQPVVLHYTDAYTPYGPIVAGEQGLGFFTLRGKSSNSGAHYMPKSRERLIRKAGRALTAEAQIGGVGAGAAGAGHVTIEELIPTTEDGVEARLCSLGPGAAARLDASAPNGGRFLLVVSGALVRKGQRFGRRSCVFVRPEDPSPELVAADEGAEVLALQFAPYA